MESRDMSDIYGATAVEWLRRWDAGDGVWSVSMGGLGPGYEQVIQITAAEILRAMIDMHCDPAKWNDGGWKDDRDRIDAHVMAIPEIGSLGMTGAQWGAAMNLAANLYMRGPVVALSDDAIRDRLIQVSRDFPRGPVQTGKGE